MNDEDLALATILSQPCNPESLQPCDMDRTPVLPAFRRELRDAVHRSHFEMRATGKWWTWHYSDAFLQVISLHPDRRLLITKHLQTIKKLAQ